MDEEGGLEVLKKEIVLKHDAMVEQEKALVEVCVCAYVRMCVCVEMRRCVFVIARLWVWVCVCAIS